MKKTKTKTKLYIIPGWGEKITGKNYQNLINSVKDKYTVIPVEYISAENQSLSENIKQARSQIIKPSSKDIILGFSVGALIAYQLASKIKFKLAVICSISSVLEKDLLLYPKKEVEKIFNPAQIKELNKMSYGHPISPIILFYGALETPQVIKRSQKLHKRLGGNLISVGKCQHQLSGDYLEAVKKQL